MPTFDVKAWIFHTKEIERCISSFFSHHLPRILLVALITMMIQVGRTKLDETIFNVSICIVHQFEKLNK